MGSVVVFNKAFGMLRTRGPLALVRKAWQQCAGTLCARNKMRRHPTFASTDALLDFSFTTCMGIIRPIQVRSEIRHLLELLRERNCRRVMEIGTANGGTLLLFSRVAAPDAQLISLDLPGGAFGGGYPLWKRGLFRSFALPQQQIHLLRADSHEPQSLEQVKALLNGQLLDFLLIDGDHTYEGVKRDFEMYSPLVRPGGLIAFHDITPNQADVTNQVLRFWNELKERLVCEEIIEDPRQGWCGIGLVRVQGGEQA